MSIVTFSRYPSTNEYRVYRVPATDIIGLNDPPDRLFLPPGVKGMARRPSIELFAADGNSWALITGGHCDNLAQLQDFRFVRQGLRAPPHPPTVVPGAGPGPTGSAICYCRWLDQPNNRRSPLSGGTSAVALANQARAWSAIPTVPPDEIFYLRGTTSVNASTTVTLLMGEPLTEALQVGDQVAVSSAPTTWTTVLSVDSTTQITTAAAIGNGATTQTIIARRSCGVTHVELLVSMDGGTPRVATTVAVGQTAVTENVATLALGLAATESFSKFPLCRYNAIYNQRQWMAGDYRHPDRVYYSLINDPENMESYMPTRNGARVTALWKVRDALYVGTDRGIQVIQGLTSEDFQITVAKPDLVVLNHHAIGKQDDCAIVPTTRGIYLHATAFTPISGLFAPTWQHAVSGVNRSYWNDAWCAVDPVDGVYKLIAPNLAPDTVEYLLGLDVDVSAYTFYWVLDLAFGGIPQLLFDARNRTDTCAFRITHPIHGDVLVTGSQDGKIRFEVPYGDDADDNGDLLGKALLIITRHNFEGNEGGDLENDGRTWHRLWVFVESELDDWTVKLFAGDEPCLFAETANFEAEVSASADIDLVPQALHHWALDKVQGRGVTLKIVVDKPPARTHGASRSPSFVYRGWGAYHGPGKSFRNTAAQEGQGG
jgi:hypothetical protein